MSTAITGSRTAVRREAPVDTRAAALTALAAAVTMIVGAVLWASTGTDMDAALADGSVSVYLADAAANSAVLVTQLSIWIVGALLIGAADIHLAGVATVRTAASRVAHYAAVTGASIAVVAFVVWLALVTQLAPAADTVTEPVAATIAWVASRADWIATVLLVAVAPATIAVGAVRDWMPTWLARWAAVAALAGLVTIVAMFTGGLSTYGFFIVPVGLGWLIAAGVHLLRRG